MDTAAGTLLVVDDNEMNRDALQRRLTRRGYSVAVAASGEQALAAIAAQNFDLVLLDVMMPGMSGLDVLCALRAQYALTELPVIMVTAKDESQDIVAALERGANDYVTKPVDFPVVLARVHTQVSLKRATADMHHLAAQLERRNQFIRNTFGRYVTDEVVTTLLDSPTGLQLGGERRQVTLLMADLRGFTSLSETLAPEQVLAILNRYLGHMTEVITQSQGTINEFIGDLILVIFGAPVWYADHAQRAVACAVAMQRAMDSVNAEQHGAGLADVEMGIGIHTGEVVVGNIGSYKRAKYGVVGTPVNLTSRIESYTIGGQVLISEATRQAVGPILTLTRQLEVDAKGLLQPISVYEVGGIAGPYNITLPAYTEVLVSLPVAVPVRYAVLEGKYLSDGVWTGELRKLSPRSGELHTASPAPLWSDLKIQLMAADGQEVPGALYAKILNPLAEEHDGVYVHFTYVPPAVATFLQQLLASNAPASGTPS